MALREQTIIHSDGVPVSCCFPKALGWSLKCPRAHWAPPPHLDGYTSSHSRHILPLKTSFRLGCLVPRIPLIGRLKHEDSPPKRGWPETHHPHLRPTTVAANTQTRTHTHKLISHLDILKIFPLSSANSLDCGT